jgi:hypothetical protein
MTVIWIFGKEQSYCIPRSPASNKHVVVSPIARNSKLVNLELPSFMIRMNNMRSHTPPGEC